MKIVAARMKVKPPPDTAVNVEVDLGMTGGAYFIQGRLNVKLPGIEREVAQQSKPNPPHRWRNRFAGPGTVSKSEVIFVPGVRRQAIFSCVAPYADHYSTLPENSQEDLWQR